MTLQIAIVCSDGFVLASDLNARTVALPSSYPSFQSKTRISEAHGIAFALAGEEPPGVNALDDLNQALNNTHTFQPDYMRWLEGWATAYIQRHIGLRGSFLIVNPRADQGRIMKLYLEPGNCRAVPDLRWMLHPDPSNPSTFWLQYFKSQDRPNLETGRKIAALTIFMASRLSPQGISGLEIAEYRDGWRQLSEVELGELEQRCRILQLRMDAYIRH